MSPLGKPGSQPGSPGAHNAHIPAAAAAAAAAVAAAMADDIEEVSDLEGEQAVEVGRVWRAAAVQSRAGAGPVLRWGGGGIVPAALMLVDFLPGCFCTTPHR
jgi:hypothetical protein